MKTVKKKFYAPLPPPRIGRVGCVYCMYIVNCTTELYMFIVQMYCTCTVQLNCTCTTVLYTYKYHFMYMHKCTEHVYCSCSNVRYNFYMFKHSWMHVISRIHLPISVKINNLFITVCRIYIIATVRIPPISSLTCLGQLCYMWGLG